MIAVIFPLEGHLQRNSTAHLLEQLTSRNAVRRETGPPAISNNFISHVARYIALTRSKTDTFSSPALVPQCRCKNHLGIEMCNRPDRPEHKGHNLWMFIVMMFQELVAHARSLLRCRQTNTLTTRQDNHQPRVAIPVLQAKCR